MMDLHLHSSFGILYINQKSSQRLKDDLCLRSRLLLVKSTDQTDIAGPCGRGCDDSGLAGASWVAWLESTCSRFVHNGSNVYKCNIEIHVLYIMMSI